LQSAKPVNVACALLRSGMFSRTAIIVPVVGATALAIGLTVFTSRSRCESPTPGVAMTTPPARAMTTPPARAMTTPPAPVTPPSPYVQPVGNQYLGVWGQQMAANNETPRLFLLGKADLASNRHSWKVPMLAQAMTKELDAVLDEGCKGRSCNAEVEHARASLRAFVDDDALEYGAPRIRHWTTDDDIHEDHRQIDITGRAGSTTFDVRCTCTSSTVGMRMWNDIAACEGTLRDRGKILLRYAPTTESGSGKEAISVPLDAYDQTVTFASGAQLIIQSGYHYVGDDVTTRRTRGAPRGALSWTSGT
jgi:hypothetical protein